MEKKALVVEEIFKNEGSLLDVLERQEEEFYEDLPEGYGRDAHRASFSDNLTFVV